MDTLPPELFILIARFYLRPCPSIFAGEWSLTGQTIDSARALTDDRLSTLRNRHSLSGQASPIVLCHINSRLRTITQNEPSLWSYLSICNPRSVELVQLWLGMLRDAPLYLDLYFNYSAGPDLGIQPHDPEHCAYKTLKSLLQIAPQWKRARIGICNAHTFDNLFIEVPAGATDSTGTVPTATILQRSEIDPQDYKNLILRSTAAFRQLESLVMIDAPDIPAYVGNGNPSLPYPVYYPLLYSPHLRHMRWSFWYFPDWIVSPNHLPGRWTTLTELVFIAPISGETAYKILQHTKALERFAPLGGLRTTPSTIIPTPGMYPNSFPTDKTIESGVQELVFHIRLLSFYALVQYVKFPHLRRLRVDAAATVTESPWTLVSVQDAWEQPSESNHRRSVVQLLLEGRDRSEVVVEVVNQGIAKEV